MILLLPIIIPAIIGALILLVPNKIRGIKEAFALISTSLNLYLAITLYKTNMVLTLPWAGYGFEFSLRLYQFSAFIMLAIAGFGFLVSLYSTAFMKDKKYLNQFYAYFLFTIALVNGAVLADNLMLLLFFWEGLLLTLFGMITIGNKDAFKTATKAVILCGVADVCLMFGMGLTGFLAGTFAISKISLALTPLASIAFILMGLGAVSKAGSMPFHSWIPDAALDAPLPFMAILPGAIEKLLGIYLLTRITLDIFKFSGASWLSILMMSVGALTILFAVMMALIQKDYKRLLAYHAISQVGYMILGIGTFVPAGIIGGLFHMINNALYKSCLFLTGGSVEKQAGSTKLEELGGLFSKMPITFACFAIAAVSISGVPPFNGFFSKELIYDGALERGWIFYAAALLGSFLTAASFLKLGHAAFFGKSKNTLVASAVEPPWTMLVPMITIAGACIFFGLFNYLPITKFIQPILPASLLEGHNFSGLPANIWLVVATVVVLLLAILNHIFGVKKSGSAAGASDHIHYVPGLHQAYDMAEKRYFDPYDIGLKIVNVLSLIGYAIDRVVDWVYESFVVGITSLLAKGLKKAHSGSYAVYIGWIIVGAFFVIMYIMK